MGRSGTPETRDLASREIPVVPGFPYIRRPRGEDRPFRETEVGKATIHWQPDEYVRP